MRATLPAHPRLLDVGWPEPEALHIALRRATDGGRTCGDSATRRLPAPQPVNDQCRLHAATALGWDRRHRAERRHLVANGHARAAEWPAVLCIDGDHHPVTLDGVRRRRERIG